MRTSHLVLLVTSLLFATGVLFPPPIMASSVRAKSRDNTGLPRILFVLSESPGRKGHSPQMKFTLSTDDPYSCQVLKASVSVNDDVVRLGPVIAVPLSGPCPPSVVPATGVVPVSLKPGRYQLIVVVDKQEDRYAIHLTGSTITIRPVKPPIASAVLHEVEARLLPNSFALGCGTLKETKTICGEAIAVVRKLPGVVRLTVQPDAHLPYRQANGYWHNEPTVMFVYKSKESLALVEPALRALLLRRVGKQNGHMLEISTWQGQDIHISESTR